MSGIAKILFELGYKVSGSDLKETTVTQRLQADGVKVYIGHRAENITPDVNSIVVSTAIPEDNPEIKKARELNLPIIRRGEMLAKLMELKKGIAVAGAHGKTTTSSMLALVLEKNFLDPTIIVGGDIQNIGGNAKFGQGEYLVAEADESDGSFLKLSPFISVITNIEDDHLDYYGNKENILKAFKEFMDKSHDKGFMVFCIDDENVKRLLRDYKKSYFTYGTSPEADYRLEDIKPEGLGSRSKVYFKGTYLGELELSVPGIYNAKNALAALVVGHQMGIAFGGIAKALKMFKGVKRRFQILGQFKGITIVDDYAHHPTEIAETLRAAKQTNAKRVVAIFQPHRYTRTQSLYKQFGQSFSNSDVTIINDIYAAGERPIEGISAKLIVEEVRKTGKEVLKYLSGKKETLEYLEEEFREGDLIITLGAGDVWQIGVELSRRLEEKEAPKGELRSSGL